MAVSLLLLYKLAIDIAAIRAKINAVIPNDIAINGAVDIPRHRTAIVQKSITKLVLDLVEGLALHGLAHVVKPGFAVVKGERKGIIWICQNGSNTLWAGCKVLPDFGRHIQHA